MAFNFVYEVFNKHFVSCDIFTGAEDKEVKHDHWFQRT
jgi:hypothetical protein